MPVGLTKGLDTLALKKVQSIYCNEETRKQTQLVWHHAAVVNNDPAVASEVVTLILRGDMRKC
jgi:hypothetical protein